MAGEFWLSDGQWARLQPLLPNKPRGVPRVDDRRVISGIVHVLQSGLPVEGCAGGLRSFQDALQPQRPLGCQGCMARGVRDAGGLGRSACRGADRQHACQSASLGGGRKRGACSQAIGVSRGGRNTKVHAITDRQGRPSAFLLTPGTGG